MAPLTLQASVQLRVAHAQSRNVRPSVAARPQRMAVRPAVAAAETEAAPEVPATEAVEVPAAERQPRQQNRQRAPRGPARTMKVSELEVGKEYDGVVVTIRDFGAFVNVGAESDGLLHISQISSTFTKSVAEVLTIGQELKVRVRSVETDTNKFAVTLLPQGGDGRPARRERGERSYEPDVEGGEKPQLKQQARAPKTKRNSRPAAPPVKVGDSIKGKVAGSMPFGLLVEISEGFTGLLHESEQRRAEGAPVPVQGDEVEVIVKAVQRDRVALSQRTLEEIEQEAKLSSKGASATVELPPGASLLARKLAGAGISADQYQAAVGAA